MSVYIQNIECQVPQTSYLQSFIKEKMKGWLKGPRRLNRYIESLYQNSSIYKRHSVIEDIDVFFKGMAGGKVSGPTTKVRNDLFASMSRKMCVDLARKAVEGCQNTDFGEITHLITVSCTGFFNPGPDYEIIQELHLNKSIRRYNIGFMGCYASFPALCLAHTVCLADPGANVLIVALELCTVHAQIRQDLDSIRSGAIFADGGAAMIVSSKPPTPKAIVFELEHFESALIPDTKDDMTWTIGDRGFEMVLSQNVPKIIESNILPVLKPILGRRGMSISDIDHWAVHPGGKSILDKIESSLGLENRLQESRSVLKRYGNMSSATILFVLKQILQKPGESTDESVLALAFGPGLTVEVAFLNKITESITSKEESEFITFMQSSSH